MTEREADRSGGPQDGGDGDPWLDRPAPVRAEETLDPGAVLDFLRGHGLADDASVTIEQFPRGFSNLTYLVTCGTRHFVLRRPPAGVGKGVAHDVLREARLLAALGTVFPRVPGVLATCEDAAIVGAPFYLMARARGIILRDRLPSGLVLDAAQMRQVSEAAIDTLAEIHAVDYRAAGLEGLGRPEGYTTRQVEGWSRRFAACRTGPQPDVERLVAWLAGAVPPERGHALVHNDFKYDNLVLSAADPSRVVAVLDWEMATIGDPWMDLGTTLAYWVEADDPPMLRSLGLGVTALPGNLTREAVVARYARATGRAVPDMLFYYVFGVFKVAVIAQQIFARFAKGTTHDERFTRLDRAVAALGEAGVRALDRGQIGSAR